MDAMNASCKATATSYLVGSWAKYSARLPDLKKPYIGSIEWLYRVMNYATQTTLLPGVALPQEPLARILGDRHRRSFIRATFTGRNFFLCRTSRPPYLPQNH